MRRLLFLVAAISLSGAAAALSAEPSAPAAANEAAKLALAMTDVILARHIDPPTRQQMVLSAIKSTYETAGVQPPDGLSRRISAASSPEQFTALILDTWPRVPVTKATPETLVGAFQQGLLSSIPGSARLIDAKERKVEEQLAGNLYVGIQIALAYDQKAALPQVGESFEGGPAHRAGVRAGDFIEDVDGRPTKGMDLRKVVERLRGEEGTKVVIKVRQPGSSDVRTLTLTRGRLPRESITGVAKRKAGGWDVRLKIDDPIGYLKIASIMGSTPQELRKLARQLEADGARALVLDLRGVHQAPLHATVLLADYLLKDCPIGRVRTADGVTIYRSDSDELFRGWPIAVLVDGRTMGAAEWLAAALQDHRAKVVGTPTAAYAFLSETVSAPGSDWSIEMITGRLERANGRPIGPPGAPPSLDPTRRNSLARQPGMRGEAPEPRTRSRPYGVNPDHLIVAALRAPMGRFEPPGGPQANAPRTVEIKDDPVLKKAVAVLREALGGKSWVLSGPPADRNSVTDAPASIPSR